MRIGDIVKSLDFVGIDSCYLVGKVVGVYPRTGEFRAQFIKRVWQGAIDNKYKTDYFTAPLQGNHFMDSDDNPRVIVIG